MSGNYDKLTIKLIELLEKDPGQTVKQLAEQLGVNRTFLSGYLKALENQGYVRSKKIGPAKVYFNKRNERC
ncbi:MAG: winged helix-turn-helix domain-containing protein [Nitrososphaerota archaeon]